MRITNTLAALGWAAWIVVAVPQAWAGEGHDHDEAPVAATGPALPRFAAVSESFELVGIVNGKQITLYLDHYADGSPVKDARLELELGGIKVPVERHAEGEFEAKLAQELKPGELAVAATVIAGEKSDLLAGDLDIHNAAPAEKTAHGRGWKEYALWFGAAGVLLVFILWLMRRLRAARNPRFGGAA